MSSVQFAAWMNDTFVNNGQSPYFDTNDNGTGRFDQVVKFYNATPVSPGVRKTADGELIYEIPGTNSTGQWLGGFSLGIADTDWYDLLYKDSSFSQSHNVSASGGTKKFNYYVSGSFFSQNGLLKLGEESLKRYTGTAKIESELTPWMKLRYSIRFTREDQTEPSSATGGWIYTSLAKRGWPVLPAYDQNGHPYYSDNTSVWSLKDGGRQKSENDMLYQQVGLTFEPLKNWKTHVDFSYRTNSTNNHSDYLPLFNYDKNENPYYRRNTSSVHEDFYKDNYYNFSARTEYDLTLVERHHLDAMAGMQVEDLKQTKFGATRNGMIDLNKPEIDLTTGMENGKAVTPAVNGSRAEWAVVGFFGRLNYDYMSRYLLEMNLRSDGSSRFRKGHQWKTFPSFSVGWNIAEETFMKSTRNWLDMLKLRFSYGSLGNQNTNNWYYTYLTMGYNPTGGTWLQNGQKTGVAYAPGIISETLTWERVATYNIGLDWTLLNNRLTGSFNWYTRNTHDMVGAGQALPGVLGTEVPKTNNTDLQSRGWELSIGWRDRLANGLNYSARFSLYDARTKITRYPNNPTHSIAAYNEGRYTGEIWGYETIGIAKTDAEMESHLASLPNGGQNAIGSKWAAGDIMYRDINNDGKISGGNGTLEDSGDMRVIGNSMPRYQFGIDLNAAWKGFDVRLFFQGVMKRDFWQGSDYHFGTGSDQWNCVGLKEIGDYFRDENTWSVKQGVNSINLDSYLPRPAGYGRKNYQVQTRYLQNAAYIRLKNLTVGYTLPKELTTRCGISALRFFFSGENLWTGTSLVKQFDPETIGSNDGNAYPLSRTYSFGLSVTF